MMKHTLTAAALATVLALPAFAQSTPPANSTTPSATPAAPAASSTATPSTAGGSNFISTQNSTDWRSSKLVGASVYGPDNASIGEINDVIVGSDGKVNAVVVGVGGFLGVGEKDVALPFQAISVTRKADSASIDKITVSYTKDQLKSAPKFAYYEPASSKSSTTGSGRGSSSGSATGSDSATKPMNGTTAPKP